MLDASHSTKIGFGRMLCGQSGDNIHQMLAKDAITSFGLLVSTTADRLHEFCFHSVQEDRPHVEDAEASKRALLFS